MPALSVLSQESDGWKRVEVGGVDPQQQKDDILKKLAPLLVDDAFARPDEQAQQTVGHDEVESRVRDEAEELDDSWRQNYENAADNFRETQQRGSTLLILARQIDNNLSLYQTELESARSKRDGFFHSFSGLGKSYIVHVHRRLIAEEEGKSADYLSSLTEDCAKRFLARTRPATLVLSEFGIAADDSYTQGATIVVKSADVVSQGSPPAWGFVDGEDGGYSFDYIQAYNVFPQYEPKGTEPPRRLSSDSPACQADELATLDSLPDLQILRDDETRLYLGELIEQRDFKNNRVGSKFKAVYSTFIRQMKASRDKLGETQQKIRQDIKSMNHAIDQLISAYRRDHPFSSELSAARDKYARSDIFLGSDVDFDSQILDEKIWGTSLRDRGAARKTMEDILTKMVQQAADRLSNAISDRSLILWQRGNVLIQGDPGNLAKTTVADMIDALYQRAERLRSYKVLTLINRPQRESQILPTQVLTSVAGTEFYQPGIPRRIVFPRIGLRYSKEDPLRKGLYIRSLEIFLAIHFFYEQKTEGYDPPPPYDVVAVAPPRNDVALAPPPRPEPPVTQTICSQALAAAAAQSGPVRSFEKFVFLFEGDTMTRVWYVDDQRIPRGRLEEALSSISCFSGWRLPEIRELRSLAGHVSSSGGPHLPQGLWSNEDDGLGTEWRVFFPEDGSDDYRGRASMLWFAAVTDSPPNDEFVRYAGDRK